MNSNRPHIKYEPSPSPTSIFHCKSVCLHNGYELKYVGCTNHTTITKNNTEDNPARHYCLVNKTVYNNE